MLNDFETGQAYRKHSSETNTAVLIGEKCKKVFKYVFRIKYFEYEMTGLVKGVMINLLCCSKYALRCAFAKTIK